MPFARAGEVCALLAPLCWAVAVIFYRKTDLPPLSMNLFKNTVAIALLTLTLGALGVAIPLERSPGDWLKLVGSGVIGIAVADTLLFEGLKRVGAARVAVIDTVYAPLMVLMSWLFLSEEPTGAFLLGSVVGTASGVMLSKPVLERSDLFEVTWTRLVAGTVALVVWTTLRGQWSVGSEAFYRWRSWKTLLPATLFGTYLSLLFWLGGFKWGDASVAAVLNQLATVYILVLARTVLGETLGVRQVVGASLAVAGAAVIVVTG